MFTWHQSMELGRLRSIVSTPFAISWIRNSYTHLMTKVTSQVYMVIDISMNRQTVLA